MKGYWAVLVLASILILGGLGLSQQAFAVITTVTHTNSGVCDTLVVPLDVDELGLVAGGFPPAELIISTHILTLENLIPSCLSLSSPSGPHSILTITNTVVPPKAFIDVWYVADPETTITNFDGLVNGEEAFRIDGPQCGAGDNLPLLSESMTLDCIFEPGEIWEFKIDDYTNSNGDPPSFFASIGVPSLGPADGSSGSIIAIPASSPPVGGTLIPIDTTALLVAGAQTMSPWLILGVLSAVGIGLAVFTLKRNH